MATAALAVFLTAATAAAASVGGLNAQATNQDRTGQDSQGRIGDSVGTPDVGVTMPLSELNLSRIGAGSQRPGDPGLGVGARYMYQATNRLALGAEISHENYGDRNFVVPGLAGTIGGSQTVAEGLARAWLTKPGAVNPYVIGGVGLNHFAAHVRETNEPSEVLLDADSVGLAMSAGGGVEGRFGATKQVVTGAEARWTLSTIDSNKFGSSVTNGLGLMGRVGYRF
jgi:hypothetical protein